MMPTRRIIGRIAMVTGCSEEDMPKLLAGCGGKGCERGVVGEGGGDSVGGEGDDRFTPSQLQPT